MKYCLSEERLDKFVSFGVNVFDIDASLEPMDIAREAICRLENLLFEELGLQRTLTEVGIGREKLAEMARKACRYGDIRGFMTLTPADVECIYEMSL